MICCSSIKGDTLELMDSCKNTSTNDDLGFLFLFFFGLFSPFWGCLGAINVQPHAALCRMANAIQPCCLRIHVRTHQKYPQVQQPRGTAVYCIQYWYYTAVALFKVTAGFHSTMSKSMYRSPAVFISYTIYSCHLTKEMCTSSVRFNVLITHNHSKMIKPRTDRIVNYERNEFPILTATKTQGCHLFRVTCVLQEARTQVEDSNTYIECCASS